MTPHESSWPTGASLPEAAPLPLTAASARRRRAPLAAKLALAFIGLVALVLLVNGAVEAWLGYTQAKHAALEVQAEKARSAADRVDGFLSEIQTVLGWTTGAEWKRTPLDQQRYDFIRLLRQAPAITALSYIDGQGKEQLAVSRLEPDSIASGKDFSGDPRFARAVVDKVWFGPVEFRRGSEPYMTIALAHVGKNPGVTVADVNLKLIWDVISAIHVGDKGYAYVVDDKGHLIADPDLSLVLRDTDLAALPQVKKALAELGAGEAPGAGTAAPGAAQPRVGSAEIAKSLGGGDVLTAYAIAPKPRWIVFVQQPLAEAFASATQSLQRTLALLGLALALAVVSGVLLARRLAAPIRLLQRGAEQLGAGDYSQRIDVRTGDEIEVLADRFNQMAERVKESHENLEAKVEARTRDLQESLAQQTATADVLKVISRSAFDLNAVLKTLSDSARSLSGAATAVVFLRDGEIMRLRAESGCPPEFLAYVNAHPIRVGRETMVGRVMMTGEAVHLPDVLADPEYSYGAAPRLGNYRANFGAPLTRDGKVDGVFGLMRPEPGAFTPRQIELVRTFADQAAIAIENVRLFGEVQEALERETATSEILRVISRSPTDAQPVFESIVSAAARSLRCDKAFVLLRDGDVYVHTAGATPQGPIDLPPDRVPIDPTANFPSRAILAGETLHLPDWSRIELPKHEHNIRSAFGVNSAVYLPLLREGECMGVIAVVGTRSNAFGAKEITQAESFRDQAVIAIENARLFKEVQAKTRDLEEALRQQTATADVLKVISRSAFDLQAVLTTLAGSACELCGASFATINIRDGDVMRFQAHSGLTPEAVEFLRSHPIAPGRDTNTGLVMLSGRVAHRPDVLADPEYDFGAGPEIVNYRAVLAVPLLRDGRVEGVFNLARSEPGPFAQRQIEMVQAFADQAVVAIENARLFGEVQARTRELAASLDDLRKAQDRLIQSEKLASLGQLTAGIAHEIKNPLNFVNNFSGLSRELLGELRELLREASLDERTREEADGLAATIASNLDKVVQHGGRADSIVKNMLLHAREGSGERTETSVNMMVEEALNLAYHGARAEKPGFNITIVRELDPDAGKAVLYPQEITRVLLNLISNGFYATTKRRQAGSEPGYEPTLTASTRNLGDHVEIGIQDNGTGIPDSVKEKMFNPFFTTKPAGEGTGLGLSLSHDIVVKQHGGAIDVESTPGSTRFVIRLPRADSGAHLKPGDIH